MRKKSSNTQPILHLIASNFVGGPEKQILHHAADLRGSEYSIEIGSFRDLPELPEILTEAARRGLATHCLAGGLRPAVIRELAALLRARPGVLLCTHGFKANVVGFLAAKIARIRHIAFVRGWTAETARVRFYEILERRALARAQWVVCVSQKQAGEILRLRGRRRTAPIVVCNAMLPPFERASTAAVSRETLGLAPGCFVFGSAGRLSVEKGHRFMVEAFARVVQGDPGRAMHLLVVGEGREQPALEALAASRNLAGKVTFAGYQPNCGAWMRLMDCLVQPSLTEGTPNSVLEAMSVGLPVVATAVGGVPDLIADRRNGLLVPPEDAAALAAAMQTIAQDAELRARLARGGTVLMQEYAPETQRRKLLAVYEKVLREGRVPSPPEPDLLWSTPEPEASAVSPGSRRRGLACRRAR